MSVTIKIVYGGPIVDVTRQGKSIARFFEPTNSYVDTPVFTEGHGEDYGKSIYATNVEGWGKLDGLKPMASTPVKFAEYEQAIIAAANTAEGAVNAGVTFTVDGYTEELYWNQMAPNMVSQGFYTKVGDKEYGVLPENATPYVKLDKASATIAVAGTCTLVATTLPADASVTWTSSADGKAEVTDGVVTGVEAGEAVITAKITVDGTDYSATCTVTVTA